jgi:hypothetical protein
VCSLANSRFLHSYWNYLSDVSVSDMAADLPVTKEELAAIGGIGQSKVESWGDIILATIYAFLERNNLLHLYPHAEKPTIAPCVTWMDPGSDEAEAKRQELDQSEPRSKTHAHQPNTSSPVKGLVHSQSPLKSMASTFAPPNPAYGSRPRQLSDNFHGESALDPYADRSNDSHMMSPAIQLGQSRDPAYRRPAIDDAEIQACLMLGADTDGTMLDPMEFLVE